MFECADSLALYKNKLLIFKIYKNINIYLQNINYNFDIRFFTAKTPSTLLFISSDRSEVRSN